MDPIYPLILIRHGQAEHLVQNLTGGWSDTALTPLGEEQARLLAKRLCRDLDGAPAVLGTSCLARASQTAAILATELELTPQVLPELVDLNNGLAAGKTHAEARLLALPQSEPVIDWRPYPQAETWREFYRRTTSFIEAYSARQTTAAILVTHFANIDVITSWWLGLPVESPTHFEISPASLTVLTISKYNERAVERLNDTAHLFERGLADPMQLFVRKNGR
jgi:probable phosphoglycerate mutase